MAKAPKAPAIDAEAQYRVTLSRPVRLSNGILLRPRDHDIVVKGARIEELGDAVISSEQIEV